MNVTLELYWINAIIEEMAMNTTTRTRSQMSFAFSPIFFTMVPDMKSRVRVELEVRTRDESVDIDADRTRITTTAIRMSGSVASIVGTMASKPIALT